MFIYRWDKCSLYTCTYMYLCVYVLVTARTKKTTTSKHTSISAKVILATADAVPALGITPMALFGEKGAIQKFEGAGIHAHRREKCGK